MAVADYTYDTLPAAERSALPAADDIAAVPDTPWDGHDPSARLSDALPGDDDPAS